ncbi:ATP-binding protein [[Kitasatospora] papulosa]|uniref:HD domain-containing protein n=1 Tax=[Kitasatospora] papulosa TaxID=1464011 RepID=UPI0036D1B321
MAYQETHFWKNFEQQEGAQAQAEARRLSEQFRSSRSRAKLLAAEINRDAADLTQHDISHIDALWEYAGLICGPTYVLNPAEIYVLGIAFLAHDLANGMAAIPEGIEEIAKDPRWMDTLTAEYRSSNGAYPSPEALADVDPDIHARAVSRYLRETHADYAAKIPMAPYVDVTTESSYYLIEDAELRSQYGHLAGRIAASHWWPAKVLRREFGVKIGARASMPTSWEVDPLSLACILRCADASHLDSRRAPAFLRAVRNPGLESMPHWVFQDKLQKPRLHDDRLSYTSLSPFGRKDSEAWWVCYDALSTLHHELAASDNILSDAGRQRFSVRGVVGVTDLEELSRNIRTEGWHPIDATIKATDVINLARRLGGAELYGSDPSVPVRELISNAADAVRAKRALLAASGAAPWEVTGDITVSLRKDDQGDWLHIRDTGLGMSKDVLTNALLNFGTSYWDSVQSRRDLPGLLSSGFRPTGQYGIGFFSVFMVGRSIRVISRRYDASASETMVLEFNNGLAGRPMLRTADPQEQLITGGTEVRVLLDSPIEKILEFEPERSTDFHKQIMTLGQYCAWLCPGLDVDLYTADDDGVRSHTIAADDWKTIDRDLLIDRVYAQCSPATIEALKSVLVGDLESVYSEGEMVARLAVAPEFDDPEHERDSDSDDSHYRSTVEISAPLIVGGVRAKTSMSQCAGLVVGAAVRAARDIAVPIVPPQGFSDWASAQARLWQRSWESFSGGACGHLVALHADTASMPIAETAAGQVTYEQLVVHCAQLSRVILLQDAAWHNYCRRSQGEDALDESVILMDPGRRTPLRSGKPYGAGDHPLYLWSMGSGPHFFAPNSMTGVVLRALSEAWGVEESIIYSAYTQREERKERVVMDVGVTVEDAVSKTVRLRVVEVIARDDLRVGSKEGSAPKLD